MPPKHRTYHRHCTAQRSVACRRSKPQMLGPRSGYLPFEPREVHSMVCSKVYECKSSRRKKSNCGIGLLRFRMEFEHEQQNRRSKSTRDNLKVQVFKSTKRNSTPTPSSGMRAKEISTGSPPWQSSLVDGHWFAGPWHPV